MGGAVARPTADHVWSAVSSALDQSSDADADFDSRPALDARGAPWPLFVSLLVANGWFLWPKGFPHRAAGGSVEGRYLNAILRLVVFIAAWGAAFWLLPGLWVGAGLAVWAAWITPRIKVINDEFQNEAVS